MHTAFKLHTDRQEEATGAAAAWRAGRFTATSRRSKSSGALWRTPSPTSKMRMTIQPGTQHHTHRISSLSPPPFPPLCDALCRLAHTTNPPALHIISSSFVPCVATINRNRVRVLRAGVTDKNIDSKIQLFPDGPVRVYIQNVSAYKPWGPCSTSPCHQSSATFYIKDPPIPKAYIWIQ